MTQEELNNLKIGEKAVDIQEYYWGPNGKILAYKVTIYTCIKYFLFFKKIKEFTFPFYFVSKEFALEFLKVYENYDFNYIEISSNLGRYIGDGIILILKNLKIQKFNYVLIDAYQNINTPVSGYNTLFKGGIWGGKISSTSIYSGIHNIKDCFNYSYIEEKEKLAAKEGTVGKTYSFKMIEENEKRCIK